MTDIKDDDIFVDDFDLNESLDSLFKDEDTIITDFVDYSIANPSKECYKKFNKKYEEYKKLTEIMLPTHEEREKIVILGEELAISIAIDFDFKDEEVTSNKKEYIEFARERLVEGSKKPYYRPMSMLYYIRALYGETNIAFNLDGDNRKTNIRLGHEYVTRLERYTDIRVLKAYALSLRAYRYIIYGDVLDMSSEEKLKALETDLVYATKWDEQNYLAEYALGLVYLNKSSQKYNIDKAMNQFENVVKLENVNVALDKYVNKEEKDRIIALAKKKIDTLKSQL